MKLTWIKCKGNVWCKLNNVNLNHSHFDQMEGVYIIWHGNPDPATVYVGQGYIRERLAAHRLNPKIQQYKDRNLYVTWAMVSQANRDGVEAFLARKLSPKVAERHPNNPEIEVNIPW